MIASVSPDGPNTAGEPDPWFAGLCATCRHVRLVPSSRGQTFYMCRRAEADPAFPRYPALPVLRCRGYEPAPPAGSHAAMTPAPGDE